MNNPLIVIGAGGHASVLVDVLLQQQRQILGIVSPEVEYLRNVFVGVPMFTQDLDVLNFDNQSVCLVNGVGSLPGCIRRRNLHNHFYDLGYKFETVVSSNAVVSLYAELGAGVQVMPGAIIQAGVRIGENTIINSGAIIEHDCHIGANNHIAPGATLSGGVVTKDNVHIGTGAVVIESVTINKNVTVGAGAIVTKDIEACYIVYPSRGSIKKGEVN